jgi:exonuclease VII small subunit
VETKREKFIRLAEKRMDNILKGIELMGNLSNSNNYEYTQEDLNKIIKTLKNSISDLEHTYNVASGTKKFKL